MAERPLDDRLRIGVIGPGAMGCLFGSLLALAGHEVWMLCRQVGLAELLEREGILLERDGTQRRAEVRATADPREAHPLDLAIVLVKSHATYSAARSLLTGAGPDSHLVVTSLLGLALITAIAVVWGYLMLRAALRRAEQRGGIGVVV